MSIAAIVVSQHNITRVMCYVVLSLFLLKMVSVDICCFTGVILSPYKCSYF